MARLGSYLPPVTPAADDVPRLLRLLETHRIGGVLLFHAHADTVVDALDAVQGAARIPLLVAADVERGVGQQVDGATEFPHARALTETDDPEAAVSLLAKATAREARACGIHWAFAPVADVNTCTENPIIGLRAFGETTDAVADHVRTYVRTAHTAGMATTAKHFPGHGRTPTDSHATLPTVEAAADALEAVDLPPFQAAIDAGVDAIMTAHVRYPALGAETPATASRALLTERLRDAMGFDGLVVSDSLRMEGLTADIYPPHVLLDAGVDLLLDPPDAVAVIDDLVAAVENGTLPEQRLREACGRVLALKRTVRTRWGPKAFVPSHRDDPVGTASLRAEANRRAADAIDVQVRDAAAWPLPPDDVQQGRDLMVVHVTPRDRSNGDSEPLPLEAHVREHYPAGTYHTVHAGTSHGEREALREQGLRASHLVVVCSVVPAAWHAFGLPSEQQALVEEWIRARPVVLAALGDPNGLAGLPQPAATVCTYSDVPAAQRALVRAVAGKREAVR